MSHRYKSMDLLRSIAILLVVVGHTVLSYGSPQHLKPLQFGGSGVSLFFVLSGWLLGGLLFKESKEFGQIDIKRFWIRRWMRTFPAYYTVLCFSVIQRYLTKDNVSFPFDYFVFVQNYDYPLAFFTVSWSLCVEEQFYLLIAPIIFLLIRTKRSITTLVLLCLFLMPFVFRQLGLYGHANETHVRIDCCAAGVLLAHFYHHYPEMWNKIVKVLPYLGIFSLILYILFFICRYYPDWWIQNPDKLVLAFIFGTWVATANSNRFIVDKLYVPGAYYISTRSYSIYLLHPEILALLKRFFLNLPFPVYLFLSFIGSLMISEILYRIIEKPIMDSREYFKFSKSLSSYKVAIQDLDSQIN